MNLLQRLVIANLFGFGFLGGSWVVVVLIYEASDGCESWALPWLLGSLLLILLDVSYRYRGTRSKTGRERDGVLSRFNNRWLGPLRGATLILLPAWVVGAVAAAVFAVLTVLDFLWTDSHLRMIG